MNFRLVGVVWVIWAVAAAASGITDAKSIAPGPQVNPIDNALDTAQQNIAELKSLHHSVSPDTDHIHKLIHKLRGEALDALTTCQQSIEGELPSAQAASRSRAPSVLRARAKLGSIVYLRGEVERLTAAALPPDHAERTSHLDTAAVLFTTLSVDFLDLPVGQLGQIGRARVLRMRGQLSEAEDLLVAMLEPNRRRADVDAPPEIRRLAIIEQLEIGLLVDPPATQARIEDLLRRRELGDDVRWVGRIRWALARALTTQAIDSTDPALANKAVIELRDASVIEVAQPYPRYELLHQLTAIDEAIVMSFDEMLEWAQALAATGRAAPAVAVFDQLAKVSPSNLTPPAQMTYAQTLWRLDRYEDAAEQFQHVLSDAKLSADLRRQVINHRASCLAAAYRSTQSIAADTALNALASVFSDDNQPRDARLQSLRQWTAIQNTRAGQAECVSMLRKYQTLAENDSYLRFTIIAGQWQRLQQRHQPSVTDDSTALDLINEVDALSAGDARYPAHAILLKAQILASDRVNDPRQAAILLRDHWSSLASSPDLTSQAITLRVGLLTKSGMFDEARSFVTELERSEDIKPDAILTLAEAIATDSSVAEDAATRRQIVAWCERAVNESIDSETAYVLAVRRAATLLMTINEYERARRMIAAARGATLSDELSAQAAALVLLEAQALRALARHEDAIALLNEITANQPAAAEAHLLMGQVELDLSDQESALTSFRAAREYAIPGSDLWWKATIEVVALLHRTGQTHKAAQLLRVADVLYPLRLASPDHPRLQTLTDELNDSVKPARKSDGDEL